MDSRDIREEMLSLVKGSDTGFGTLSVFWTLDVVLFGIGIGGTGLEGAFDKSGVAGALSCIKPNELAGRGGRDGASNDEELDVEEKF